MAHAGHSDVVLAAAVGVGAMHDAAHGHLPVRTYACEGVQDGSESGRDLLVTALCEVLYL